LEQEFGFWGLEVSREELADDESNCDLPFSGFRESRNLEVDIERLVDYEPLSPRPLPNVPGHYPVSSDVNLKEYVVLLFINSDFRISPSM